MHTARRIPARGEWPSRCGSHAARLRATSTTARARESPGNAASPACVGRSTCRASVWTFAPCAGEYQRLPTSRDDANRSQRERCALDAGRVPARAARARATAPWRGEVVRVDRRGRRPSLSLPVRSEHRRRPSRRPGADARAHQPPPQQREMRRRCQVHERDVARRYLTTTRTPPRHRARHPRRDTPPHLSLDSTRHDAVASITHASSSRRSVAASRAAVHRRSRSGHARASNTSRGLYRTPPSDADARGARVLRSAGPQVLCTEHGRAQGADGRREVPGESWRVAAGGDGGGTVGTQGRSAEPRLIC